MLYLWPCFIFFIHFSQSKACLFLLAIFTCSNTSPRRSVASTLVCCCTLCTYHRPWHTVNAQYTWDRWRNEYGLTGELPVWAQLLGLKCWRSREDSQPRRKSSDPKSQNPISKIMTISDLIIFWALCTSRKDYGDLFVSQPTLSLPGRGELGFQNNAF